VPIPTNPFEFKMVNRFTPLVLKFKLVELSELNVPFAAMKLSARASPTTCNLFSGVTPEAVPIPTLPVFVWRVCVELTVAHCEKARLAEKMMKVVRMVLIAK
jgi:hypothetical protein